MSGTSSLAGWTPEQVDHGRRWVVAWREAGVVMEQLRRQELRDQDNFTTLAHLCRPADYTRPPFAPIPTSGLVEQQRWFSRLRR